MKARGAWLLGVLLAAMFIGVTGSGAAAVVSAADDVHRGGVVDSGPDPRRDIALGRLAYWPATMLGDPVLLPSQLSGSAPVTWPRGWRGVMGPASSPQDSLRRTIEHLQPLAPEQLLEAARLAQRLGHDALADSLWHALAATRNPWTWDAARLLAAQSIARGDPAGADSQLAAVDTTGFTQGEQADLCLVGARAAEGAGDTGRQHIYEEALATRFPGTWAAAHALEQRPELPRGSISLTAPIDTLAPLRQQARAAETAFAWDAALALQSRVAAAGAASDRGRAAMLALASGRTAVAESLLAGATDDAGRFWASVLLRTHARAAGDSALRALAELPGFGWYRVLARDSLGEPAPVAAPATLTASGVWERRAEGLLAAGDPAECIRMIHRGATDGPRGLARGGEPGRSPIAWCEMAALAFALGRLPLGIVLARTAPEQPGPLSPAYRAALVPYIYPPGLELVAPRALADLAASALDVALLSALAWQESKFDTAARSASDARGLMQMKLATAAEVAFDTRWRVRRDADLARADLNLELGARYFDRLLAHFHGDTLLAVAGYNGGPGAVSRWWQAGGAALLARGGAALVAEFVLRPETEDYVKLVMGTRAAYRALRPMLGPAPR